MKQVSGKDFVHIAEQHGWQLKRSNGSHHILAKPDHRERLSVPVHGNTPLKTGLLHRLIKISGIPASAF